MGSTSPLIYSIKEGYRWSSYNFGLVYKIYFGYTNSFVLLLLLLLLLLFLFAFMIIDATLNQDIFS